MARIVLKNYLKTYAKIAAALDSSQCARLIQAIENDELGRLTQVSKYGGTLKVRICDDIVAGTVIATLIDGKYPNEKRGNHIAIFVSKQKDGITVFDQYTGKPPGNRDIRYKGGTHSHRKIKNPDGQEMEILNMSNDGDFYYVVEISD